MPKGIYKRKKITEATRMKMSLAQMGNKHCLGYKHSEETKKRMSEGHIKIGSGKWNIGHKHSEEAKKRMSETHKRIGSGKGNIGRKASAEAKKKMSLAQTGKKRSEETKRKMRRTLTLEQRLKYSEAAAKGKNSHRWRGGRTKKRQAEMGTPEYRWWRYQVYKRDKYTCQECGAKNGNGKSIILNAHHIKPYSKYPELRLQIKNGTTLCVECHRKIHNKRGL